MRRRATQKNTKKKTMPMTKDIYEVETIKDKRLHNGNLQYLIKWQNYPEEENTWEPPSHLGNIQDMIKDFEHRQDKSKSKSRASRASRTTKDNTQSIIAPEKNPKSRLMVISDDNSSDQQQQKYQKFSQNLSQNHGQNLGQGSYHLSQKSQLQGSSSRDKSYIPNDPSKVRSVQQQQSLVPPGQLSKPSNQRGTSSIQKNLQNIQNLQNVNTLHQIQCTTADRNSGSRSNSQTKNHHNMKMRSRSTNISCQKNNNDSSLIESTTYNITGQVLIQSKQKAQKPSNNKSISQLSHQNIIVPSVHFNNVASSVTSDEYKPAHDSVSSREMEFNPKKPVQDIIHQKSKEASKRASSKPSAPRNQSKKRPQRREPRASNANLNSSSNKVLKKRAKPSGTKRTLKNGQKELQKWSVYDKQGQKDSKEQQFSAKARIIGHRKDCKNLQIIYFVQMREQGQVLELPKHDVNNINPKMLYKYYKESTIGCFE